MMPFFLPGFSNLPTFPIAFGNHLLVYKVDRAVRKQRELLAKILIKDDPEGIYIAYAVV
jgi:hypothetical protein